MRRVKKKKMEMIVEWNAINEAMRGEDPDDPVIEDEEVPEVDLTPWEIEALKDIGAM